jgi:hypothetical protein
MPLHIYSRIRAYSFVTMQVCEIYAVFLNIGARPQGSFPHSLFRWTLGEYLLYQLRFGESPFPYIVVYASVLCVEGLTSCFPPDCAAFNHAPTETEPERQIASLRVIISR